MKKLVLIYILFIGFVLMAGYFGYQRGQYESGKTVVFRDLRKRFTFEYPLGWQIVSYEKMQDYTDKIFINRGPHFWGPFGTATDVVLMINEKNKEKLDESKKLTNINGVEYWKIDGLNELTDEPITTYAIKLANGNLLEIDASLSESGPTKNTSDSEMAKQIVNTFKLFTK